MTERRLIKEILQRVARIETRFTRYMIDRGFDTGVEKPRLSAENVIVAPSPDVRMSDLLAVIPISLAGMSIPVFVGNDKIGEVTREADYDR